MSERQRLILSAAVRVIARDGVRGLRMEDLAAEAGVSTALIYYHFKNRAGLLHRTLEYVSERAGRYTDEAIAPGTDPRTHVELLLLHELQDTPAIRENSTAWGELRASATFDPVLREPVRTATAEWVGDISGLIDQAMIEGQVAPHVSPEGAAERLTSLVEGLSERWLSGTLMLDRAQSLLRDAIALELDRAPRR
ncbi:TetR/AcrR family transcriptional regulator [Actinomadura harenae]|uniref:TetR/AcrR family transcriptional regulator n=1 Tax=Actinomadura harenae TaxID=2483351 RepID=A0A3M2M6X7_9ACTN|nr:TetR/AcrR family transcriptional regulator [Actinomadura harenae]RMI45457.1 TetR/AcrR family transcriptional regulator [Actinomadura harenae]